MKKYVFLLVLSALILSLYACAKPRVVTNPETPYDSLGNLELKVSNERPVLKYLTFGIMRKRSFESMTHELSKALEKEARHKYGADAVANVTYWPTPDSLATVDYVYGRAEMIRYKKFGVKAEPVAAAPEPSANPS